MVERQLSFVVEVHARTSRAASGYAHRVAQSIDALVARLSARRHLRDITVRPQHFIRRTEDRRIAKQFPACASIVLDLIGFVPHNSLVDINCHRLSDEWIALVAKRMGHSQCTIRVSSQLPFVAPPIPRTIKCRAVRPPSITSIPQIPVCPPVELY